MWERGAAQQGRRPSKKMEKINAEEEQQRRWAEKRRAGRGEVEEEGAVAAGSESGPENEESVGIEHQAAGRRPGTAMTGRAVEGTVRKEVAWWEADPKGLGTRRKVLEGLRSKHLFMTVSGNW